MLFNVNLNTRIGPLRMNGTVRQIISKSIREYVQPLPFNIKRILSNDKVLSPSSRPPSPIVINTRPGFAIERKPIITNGVHNATMFYFSASFHESWPTFHIRSVENIEKSGVFR